MEPLGNEPHGIGKPERVSVRRKANRACSEAAGQTGSPKGEGAGASESIRRCEMGPKPDGERGVRTSRRRKIAYTIRGDAVIVSRVRGAAMAEEDMAIPL